MTLRNKMLLGAGTILFLLSAALFFALRASQARLVSQEIEFILKNELLSISGLVSARPEGLDLEMSPRFMEEFDRQQPAEFFRLLDADGKPVRETRFAPKVGCLPEGADPEVTDARRSAVYRVRARKYQPEIDDELVNPPPFQRPWVCLVVGIDETPFRLLSARTMEAAIPAFVIAFGIGLIALLALTRQLTGDLARLGVALQGESFNWSHPFPDLPKARTPEVAAVVGSLEALHDRASHAYRELWLFLGRAAHHLRTPVSGLQTTIEVLMRKDRTKEELVAGLEDLKTGVQMASKLTQELISASRLSYASPTHAETASLEKVVDDALRLLRSQADTRKTKIYSAGLGYKIRGDETTLLELFAPLLENAILYSGERAAITLSAVPRGEMLLVKIEDTGPGVPPEVVRRIFEPFVRGDERKAPGSGLGLSIAKRAAQLCGGDLELKETSARGTVFQARLRLA